MGLDVYLLGEEAEENCQCSCGNCHKKKEKQNLFHSSITHNLSTMARAAGLYEFLWNPERILIKKALELIEPLKSGLATLRANPDKFRQFEVESDGWGIYEDLTFFVDEYLHACEKYPEAEVKASR